MKRATLFKIILTLAMLFALAGVVGCAGDSSVDEGEALGLTYTQRDRTAGSGLTGRAYSIATDSPASSEELESFADDVATEFAEQDSPTTDSPSARDNRMLILSAEADIETKDFDTSKAGIEAALDAAGGFTQDSSLRGDGDVGNLRIYHAVLRIPQDNFEDFVQGINEHGNVLYLSRSGDDVTESFFDNEARIRILEAEETELLELMSRAESLGDIFTIRDRVSEVRTEIDRLSGQNIRTENLVTLSTVTMTLAEVQSITPPADEDDGFFARAGEVFTSSINAFVAFIQGLALVVIAVSPFLVTMLAIAAVIWLLIRRHQKKKKAALEAHYAEVAASQAQPQAQVGHADYAEHNTNQQ